MCPNDIIKKPKRNDIIKKPIEWEKISASHISDKWLVFRAYKEIYNSMIKRQIAQLKNGQKFEEKFLQRRHLYDK